MRFTSSTMSNCLMMSRSMCDVSPMRPMMVCWMPSLMWSVTFCLVSQSFSASNCAASAFSFKMIIMV